MTRLTAWRVLRNSQVGLRDVDRLSAHSNLDPRERALVRRLVATEARRRGTLRALTNAFTRGKPNADVAAHIRLGLAQLFFLDDIKDHAAVSETVGAAHTTSGPSKANYVNAVLRAAQRARCEGASGDPRRDLIGRDTSLAQPVFHDPDEHPLLWAEDALSMPAQVFKRWTSRFGEERARALARTALEDPPLSVRVVRGGREELAAELAELEPSPATHPAILRFDPSRTEGVVTSLAFLEGRITVQGESALRAAELLEAAEDERLLELAAAPGGKTAVLAGQGARIVACDINPARLTRLAETLERLGLTGRVRTVATDGCAGISTELDGQFDGLLIDAPCSNTGVLAQRPEARWRFGPASQRSLVELQGRLLSEGAEHVRAGGRLVYSTCSLEAEENGKLVRAFLDEHAGWELEAEHEAQPDHETGPTDGGYAARLRRR